MRPPVLDTCSKGVQSARARVPLESNSFFGIRLGTEDSFSSSSSSYFFFFFFFFVVILFRCSVNFLLFDSWLSKQQGENER